MPSASRALTSEASVYLGGGWVKCCVGRISTGATGVPAGSSGTCCSWRVGSPATFRYPSKTSFRPEAWKTALPAGVSASTASSVTAHSAADIWQETKRCQISS